MNINARLESDKKLNEGDIIYLVPNKKFGRFESFGKKEDRILVQMYKQNSSEPMSRAWTIKLSLCEVAFKLENGELVNQNPEKFVMEGDAYMIKGTEKKENKPQLPKIQKVATNMKKSNDKIIQAIKKTKKPLISYEQGEKMLLAILMENETA